MMNEEQVTKSIMKWLLEENWNIVCFDFPQSGTGIILHSNKSGTAKNKGGTIPDLVVIKNSKCLYFENKDKYYHKDFIKINRLINNNEYRASIDKLLSSYSVKKIYYGIGMPTREHKINSAASAHLVDFIIGVNNDFNITILFERYDIF